MGDAEEETPKSKRREFPPDGYVCRLCSVPGHWIQVCPTKKTGKRKRKPKSDHVHVPGKDPSPEDIAEAQKWQSIPPPKCFCGLKSRLNKVKRSKAGGDNSRALGKYFFFCSKKRDDETQCRFARPADLELNKMKARAGNKAAQKQKATKEKRESKQVKKAKVELDEESKKMNTETAKESSDDSSSSSSSSDDDDKDVERKNDANDSDSSSVESSSDEED